MAVVGAIASILSLWQPPRASRRCSLWELARLREVLKPLLSFWAPSPQPAWGHEIAVAADGPSALSLAETFHPDCVIVDVSMPGMNGIELGRRLRQRFPAAQIRLIALSGYADAAIRDACLGAGFNAYLVKPGDIPELERLIGGDDPDSDASNH